MESFFSKFCASYLVFCIPQDIIICGLSFSRKFPASSILFLKGSKSVSDFRNLECLKVLSLLFVTLRYRYSQHFLILRCSILALFSTIALLCIVTLWLDFIKQMSRQFNKLGTKFKCFDYLADYRRNFVTMELSKVLHNTENTSFQSSLLYHDCVTHRPITKILLAYLNANNNRSS